MLNLPHVIISAIMLWIAYKTPGTDTARPTLLTVWRHVCLEAWPVATGTTRATRGTTSRLPLALPARPGP